MRSNNRQNRNREVLSAVIESHIKTSDAISSEDICPHFDCSSATVRNTMSELEELGYLTHTHTSGGRVPTDKGYRYYVDMLLTQMRLLGEEKKRLTGQYQRQIKVLEDILEKTSEVLSSFTRCTGIVSFLNKGNKIYYDGASFITEHPEFRNIEKIRNVLKVLEEKKQLLDILNRNLEKKLNVYIGKEIECEEISGCSLIVSTYDVENKPLGRIAVLGPRSMNYSQVIPTVEYVSGLLSKALENL